MLSEVRLRPICAAAVATGATILAAAQPACADVLEKRPFSAYVDDQFTYDNNLFRLPPDFNLASGISRQDHVNTVSAGGEGEWTLDRQTVNVQLRANNSHYARNEDLNNTSGLARLEWDWILSPFLSGDAGADFTRWLAGFANTHFFQKDLIDTSGYFADARIRVAQDWTVNAGLRNADTTHGLPLRQIDNYRSRSANASIRYRTAEESFLGLEYSYTNGTFSHPITINSAPFNPDYRDSTARLVAKYALTGKLMLDGSFGYLSRNYPHESFGSFSGTTWKGTLTWQPTGKTEVAFGLWRQLAAYLGAESDYFVARGESIAPTWHATERIDLALAASWSKQDYLGASPSALELASRHDNVRTQQVTLRYTPRDFLNVEINYGLEQRFSNRNDYSYHDKVWTAIVKLQR